MSRDDLPEAVRADEGDEAPECSARTLFDDAVDAIAELRRLVPIRDRIPIDVLALALLHGAPLIQTQETLR